MKYVVGQQVYVRRPNGIQSIKTIEKIGRRWAYLGTEPSADKFGVETGRLYCDIGKVYESKAAWQEEEYRYRVEDAFRRALSGVYRFPSVTPERLIEIAAELGCKIDVPKEAK